MEAKQRVVIGAQVFWSRLTRSGAIEHPTDRDACNICRFDAEANESACEDVHDQHDPMAAQENLFDAEQVDAPQAVLSQSWVFRSKSKNWDHKFNDLQDSKFIKNKLCDRTLFPGVVARYDSYSNGQSVVNNVGEGAGWMQGMGLIPNDNIWRNQTQGILNSLSNSGNQSLTNFTAPMPNHRTK